LTGFNSRKQCNCEYRIYNHSKAAGSGEERFIAKTLDIVNKYRCPRIPALHGVFHMPFYRLLQGARHVEKPAFFV